MTVKELIEELSTMPEESEVRFTYNCGDYWRTTVAAKIASVGEGRVKHSEYHRMDCLIEEQDDEATQGEPNTDERDVVVLS